MIPVLQINGLSKSYGSTVALQNIDLSVADNEYVSLLGPSGSGKTVLLRLVAGFEPPDGGTVTFAGRNFDHVAAHQRGIGFVFQNFALFPHLTVMENIAFGLANCESGPVRGTADIRSRVERIIGLTGLDGLEQRAVHQISGGQKQRVALARTLVTEPRLVLLDEPLGALDANLRMRMRGELRRIRAQLGVTFLHVTGSETEALAMGDRIVVLDRGHIGQIDVPDVVFNQPASANVAKTLNCYNLFGGRIEPGQFVADGHGFALPARKTASADIAYAIRQDLIDIRPDSQPLQQGEAGVNGRYLASEYTGAAFMYFFELANGKIIEVDNHLSHRAAQDLDVSANYTLAWKASDALVFG